MKLILKRKIYTRRSTIGELELNGKRLCYVLEDPVRPKKIKGQTAIPAGRYRVIVSYSPRFKQRMPLLENVPNYEGVRIHAGNRPEHTEGCLLPGKTKAVDFVGSSRVAYKALSGKIDRALKQGEGVEVEIIETGVSPYGASNQPESEEKEALAASGAVFRILADPLRIRSSESTRSLSNIVGRLQEGSLVRATGTEAKPGWLHVVGETGGVEVRGYIASEYAEPVVVEETPAAVAAGSAPSPKVVEKLYEVAVSRLNFRKAPGDMTDKAIIATLPKGQVVTKTRDCRKPMWWEVETLLHGTKTSGFVYSSMLTPLQEVEDGSTDATAPAADTGGVTISEKALDLILTFEGMDQPGKWPGASSGITLGHGYDLGYHTHDQLMGDWGPHLSTSDLSRLAKSIGVRGSAAKRMASQFSDIKIPVRAADTVFAQSTVPRIEANALIAFPGITSLPLDAQGALASLVYNRGTSMSSSSRRREMREIRGLIQNGGLSMPDKLKSIAASIRSMKRLWPTLRGLRRRRDAEADLVESSL